MQPSVTMVMLYADRPQFLAQALACFRTQTYQNKWLLIYNNGRDPLDFGLFPNEALVQDHGYPGRSIGVLRNTANGFAKTDILAHLDVDDWSQPNRVTEQVALLQASGADCVGMNEMLFARGMRTSTITKRGPITIGESEFSIEAWLYSNPRPNYALGTSLAYWRKTWERSPFTDGPKPEGTSEYHHWFAQNSGIKVHSVTSLPVESRQVKHEADTYPDPMMIARIHGGNTGQYDLEKLIAGGSREWKRVPQWDARVRDILEGK